MVASSRNRLWSRRALLSSLTAPALLAELDRKRVLPSDWRRYADPATEFEVVRLTDPAYVSLLGAPYNRTIGRRSGYLLFSGDRPDGPFSGLQVFRMDLSNGQSRRLTELPDLDPSTLVLVPPERTFLCFAGPALMQVDQTTLKARELYRVPDGWRRTAGISVSVDGLYAAFCETNGKTSHVRLLALATRNVNTVVETPFEPLHPLIRPRRAQICYRQDQTALWLVDFSGSQNRRLRIAEGAIGETLWGPGGQSLLYLHLPEAGTGLNSIREHRPDANADALVTKTSQFVSFGINGDASVFVGASRNKASPLILLLVRLARREMSVAEHKAGNPEMTTPVFTPDSQRILFASDRHGKPAIYMMRVEKLVDKTEEDEDPAITSTR